MRLSRKLQGTPSQRQSKTAPQFESFLEMLRAERNASPHTIESYSRDLRHADAAIKSGLANAVTGDLQNYFQDLQKTKPPLAAASRARRLSALKQYFHFLCQEKKRSDNPVNGIERPRAGRSLPKILDQDDVKKLLAYLYDNNEAPVLRLRAMLELLYGSGLRVTELIGLPLSSFRNSQNAMIVKGKGGKERLVPLSSHAHDSVRDYLAVRTQFIKPQDKDTNRYLFPSRTATVGCVTRQRMAQMLKDAALKSGLDPAKSARMYCVMLLPPICWKAAPTFAPCSRCWGIATLPRRRSIPMSRRRICKRRCSNSTPWLKAKKANSFLFPPFFANTIPWQF